MKDYLIYKAIAVSWVIICASIVFYVAWKENRDNE